MKIEFLSYTFKEETTKYNFKTFEDKQDKINSIVREAKIDYLKIKIAFNKIKNIKGCTKQLVYETIDKFCEK